MMSEDEGFRFQCSAQPPAKKTAGLIERGTSALRNLIRAPPDRERPVWSKNKLREFVGRATVPAGFGLYRTREYGRHSGRPYSPCSDRINWIDRMSPY